MERGRWESRHRGKKSRKSIVFITLVPSQRMPSKILPFIFEFIFPHYLDATAPGKRAFDLYFISIIHVNIPWMEIHMLNIKWQYKNNNSTYRSGVKIFCTTVSLETACPFKVPWKLKVALLNILHLRPSYFQKNLESLVK